MAILRRVIRAFSPRSWVAQNQHPGGRKPEGPPDLDELWRNFNSRLQSMLGQGGRNQPPHDRNLRKPTPGGKGTSFGFAGILLIALILLWLASGFFVVQEGQVAVITQFGQFKQVMRAGFHWRLPYPIQRHEKVNLSQLRTIEVGYRGNARTKLLNESLMLTDDENIIDIQFAVQYRLKENGAADFLFNHRNASEAVMQTAETAMREVVGKKTMDFVLYEGRQEVATEVAKLMQTILDRYGTGVLISSVAIQNAQPPEQVQAAFDDAVKAGQDRERQINEGQAYANDVIPRAKGFAERLLQEAQGYRERVIQTAQGDAKRFELIRAEYAKAPQITRERMYFDTLQQIFSNTSKIVVDSKSGNNLLYLPLDKITQQVSQEAQAKAAADAAMSPTTPSAPPYSRNSETQNAGTPRADGAVPDASNLNNLESLGRSREAMRSRERDLR